ncbi:MAG: hypothetical protein WBC49_04155 [Thermoplasmata archaeon]
MSSSTRCGASRSKSVRQQTCRTDPVFVRLLMHSGAGLQVGS